MKWVRVGLIVSSSTMSMAVVFVMWSVGIIIKNDVEGLGYLAISFMLLISSILIFILYYNEMSRLENARR